MQWIQRDTFGATTVEGGCSPVENTYVVALVTILITNDRRLVDGSERKFGDRVRASAAAKRKGTSDRLVDADVVQTVTIPISNNWPVSGFAKMDRRQSFATPIVSKDEVVRISEVQTDLI